MVCDIPFGANLKSKLPRPLPSNSLFLFFNGWTHFERDLSAFCCPMNGYELSKLIYHVHHLIYCLHCEFIIFNILEKWDLNFNFFCSCFEKGLKLTSVALLYSQGWLCSSDPGLAQPSSQVLGLYACTPVPGSVCSYVETLSQWFLLFPAFPYPQR